MNDSFMINNKWFNYFNKRDNLFFFLKKKIMN